MAATDTSVANLMVVLGINSAKFVEGKNKAKKALSDFDRSLLATQRNLEKVGAQLQKTGKDLSRNLTAPLLLAGGASVKVAADFDTSMTKIETLVGLSRDTVEEMREEVLQLSGKTARAPQELADALFVITSAGQRGSAAMEILEASAKGSASGLGETKDIARAVTAVLNAYGEENISAAQAMDIFTATIREGNLEASTLAPVLGRVIGLGAQLGIGFDQIGASVATFTRLGVSSEEAVTGLRGIMNALIKPTDQAREALAKTGLTFADLRQEVKEKGLAQTMVDLIKAYEGNDEALADVIPNVRALSAVLGTASAQGDDYIDITNKIADSQGILDDAFERTTEDAGFKFEQAMSDIKVAMVDIGNQLLPLAKKAADGLSSFAKGFTDLDQGTKDWIISIAKVAIVVGPALIVIGKLATGAAALIKTMRSMPGVLTKIQGAFTKIAAMNPWLLALTAVVALASVAIPKMLAMFDKSIDKQKILNDINLKAEQAVIGQTSAINRLTDQINDQNVSEAGRLKLVNELKEQVPGLTDVLDENGKITAEAQKIIDNHTDSLLKNAKQQAINERLVAIQSRQLELGNTSINDQVSLWDELLFGSAAYGAQAAETTTEVTKLNDEQELLLNTLDELNGGFERIAATMVQSFGKPSRDIIGMDTAFSEFSDTVESDSDKIADGADKIGKGFITTADILDRMFDTAIQNLEKVKSIGDGIGESTLKLPEKLGFRTLAGEITDSFLEASISLQEGLNQLSETVDPEIQAINDKAAEFAKGTAQTFINIGAEVVSGFIEVAQGAKGIGDVIGGILESFGNWMKQLGAGMIATAQLWEKFFAALIANPVAAVGIGIALFVAGTAIAALAGNIAGFEKGGLVTGPTLALIGEGAGTTRSNPEVIAPLDKLEGMLTQTGNALSGEFVLKGADIVLLIRRELKREIGMRGTASLG